MKISDKCVFGGYDGVCCGAMTSLISLFLTKFDAYVSFFF